MLRKNAAIAALLLSLVPLTAGCAESEQETCENKAEDEWTERRNSAIANGQGGDDSLTEIYLEMESYVIDQCGTG